MGIVPGNPPKHARRVGTRWGRCIIVGMALCEVHWSSSVLAKKVGMYVILPEPAAAGPGPYATYYLLHGLSDDYTVWLRRSRIEWNVRDLPLIVVMPDGYRGFYTDNAEG